MAMGSRSWVLERQRAVTVEVRRDVMLGRKPKGDVAAAGIGSRKNSTSSGKKRKWQEELSASPIY